MSGGRARLLWPDLAKGLGIFLMTLGHSSLTDPRIVAWIYTFHMPLFFFLSGFFFSLKENRIGATLRHKAFPILMPMVTYSLCRWLWSALSAVSTGAPPDVRPLLGVALQLPGTPFAGYVWFFAGLFAAECLFALLLRTLAARPWAVLLLSFGLAGGIWAASRAGLPRLPWHLDAACLLLPYLCLGWLACRFQPQLDRLMSKRGLCTAVLLALFAVQIMSMLYNLRCGPTRIDYNLRLLNEPFSAYLSGICGVGWFWLLCRKLPAPRCLTFVGEYSSVYYCVGWLGSNLAHRLVCSLVPLNGLPLLAVHLLGMWLLPVPLILLLNRFCPEAMGKRRTELSPQN